MGAGDREAVVGIKGQNNMVILYKGPEKEGLVTPTEADITNVLEAVRNSEIKANVAEDLPKAFLDPASLKGSKASAAKEGTEKSLPDSNS